MMQRRHIVTVLFASVLCFGTGCGAGSLAHTVDKGQLQGMSHGGQIAVYDGENEIMVARDRIDEIREHQVELRQVQAQAERRLDKAEARGKPLGANVAEAWIDYLDSVDAWLSSELEYHALGVMVARAAAELTKAEVIQREDLTPGENFDTGVFRVQLDDLQKERETQATEVLAYRRAMQKKEAAWWRLRRKYVAKTGDTNSGVWID